MYDDAIKICQTFRVALSIVLQDKCSRVEQGVAGKKFRHGSLILLRFVKVFFSKVLPVC
jgi:hypothetical protein